MPWLTARRNSKCASTEENVRPHSFDLKWHGMQAVIPILSEQMTTRKHGRRSESLLKQRSNLNLIPPCILTVSKLIDGFEPLIGSLSRVLRLGKIETEKKKEKWKRWADRQKIAFHAFLDKAPPIIGHGNGMVLKHARIAIYIKH